IYYLISYFFQKFCKIYKLPRNVTRSKENGNGNGNGNEQNSVSGRCHCMNFCVNMARKHNVKQHCLLRGGRMAGDACAAMESDIPVPITAASYGNAWIATTNILQSSF